MISTLQIKVVAMISTLQINVVAMISTLQINVVAMISTLQIKAVAMISTLQIKVVAMISTLQINVVAVISTLQINVVAVISTLQINVVAMISTRQISLLHWWNICTIWPGHVSTVAGPLMCKRLQNTGPQFFISLKRTRHSVHHPETEERGRGCWPNLQDSNPQPLTPKYLNRLATSQH